MDVTTDHVHIRKWVEKRRGKPQKIPAPGTAITGLRIDFPGKEDEAFLSEEKKGEDVSWQEFFDIFEQEKLSFMYEETPASDLSLSYRFEKREPPGETEMTEEEIEKEEEEISGPV